MFHIFKCGISNKIMKVYNNISEEEKQQILEQLTKTEPDDLNNTLEIED